MANRFDEKYDIRLAMWEEIPEIMSFINDCWKKGHILAVNRKFFEYEMVVDGVVNFLIAKEKKSGAIEGILGFLPCSKNKVKFDVWGVVWKTVSTAMPMLGMELKKRLMTEIGARTDLGVGANAKTSVPLLGRIYHYYTAKMKHYYRLADIDDYRIAKVNNKVIQNYDKNRRTNVFELKSEEDMESFFDFSAVIDTIPYKDAWYYIRRFYKHPIYKYRVWGLYDDYDKAIMVTREQHFNGAVAVRIVDYCGEQQLFAGCGWFMEYLLSDCEYLDFYFDGFNEDYVKSAGLSDVCDDGNVIPDYFNPFEQVNVDIYVDSSNNTKRCLFFKADGDQDRPS